jgi:hypothetical protein
MSEIGVGIKKFNIDFHQANFNDVKVFFFIKLKILVTFIKKLSSRFFSILNSLFINNYFYEKNVNLFYDNFTVHKKAYFHGFWQNEKYFFDIKKKLIKEIDIKNKRKKHIKLLKKIEKTCSVAVHIRRGDFLSQRIRKITPLVNLSYYKKSIKFIIWVKNNIKIYNSIYVSSFNEVEDLVSISKCKHQIIANSTFSWWGAWLNCHKKKVIIAPKKWSNIQHDPCPANWKRLS